VIEARISSAAIAFLSLLLSWPSLSASPVALGDGGSSRALDQWKQLHHKVSGGSGQLPPTPSLENRTASSQARQRLVSCQRKTFLLALRSGCKTVQSSVDSGGQGLVALLVAFCRRQQ